MPYFAFWHLTCLTWGHFTCQWVLPNLPSVNQTRGAAVDRSLWWHLLKSLLGMLSCLLMMCQRNYSNFASITFPWPFVVDLTDQWKCRTQALIHFAITLDPFSLLSFVSALEMPKTLWFTITTVLSNSNSYCYLCCYAMKLGLYQKHIHF